MRASQLLVRPLAEPPDDVGPPACARLFAEGLAVQLGPGLVGAQGPLARVLARLDRACRESLEAAGAVACDLPASEGEALVNLALHGGLPARDGAGRLYALGAGFRQQGPRPRGLFDSHLYRRLDLLVAGPGQALELLAPLFARCDLADLETREEGDRIDLVAPLGQAGEEVLGQLRQRALGEGGTALQLVSLDLYALLGALAVRGADEHGTAWPAALAPWDLALLPADGAADAKLVAALGEAGHAVLVDDRPGSAGERRASLLAWGLPTLVLQGAGAGAGQLVLERRAQQGPPRRLELPALLAELGAGSDGGERRPGRRARF